MRLNSLSFGKNQNLCYKSNFEFIFFGKWGRAGSFSNIFYPIPRGSLGVDSGELFKKRSQIHVECAKSKRQKWKTHCRPHRNTINKEGYQDTGETDQDGGVLTLTLVRHTGKGLQNTTGSTDETLKLCFACTSGYTAPCGSTASLFHIYKISENVQKYKQN